MSPGSLNEAIKRRKNIQASLEFTDNFQEQLRMAGMVQRDFLPRQLPNSERFHWSTNFMPAEWVSGDIYDVVRLDENHIGFYVADVVGHGIPAALLTIFVKQAMVMRETYGNSYRIFAPAEVMANVNRKMITQSLSGNQFVTSCCCLLDTETLELTYCRAGHPHPLLIRQGEEPRQLEGKGSLVGIFEGAEYTQQTVRLERGDKIMLYSDGAEPVIGHVDESHQLRFSREFVSIKDLDAESFTAEFKELAVNHEFKAGELDDITTIALQIL